MSNVGPDRRIPGDWWDGVIPDKVQFGEGLWCETAQIFRFVRSEKSPAVILGNHVSAFSGCSFSIGKNGRCVVGDFTLLNGAIVMAEEEITIGSYCLISWGVGIADSDFHPIDPALRLQDARAIAPYYKDRPARPAIKTAPVHIRDNVWIGMNAVILKGVEIGDNSIVGAGAVVSKSVPPNCIVAGNPAKIVKRLT